MSKNNLRQVVSQTSDKETVHLWEDKIAIQCVNVHHIANGWQADGFSVYSFLLITAGRLAIEYNGQVMEFHESDLYIYAPGMPTRMISASDDYQAYLLMLDEKTVVGNPMLSLFLKSAYIPIAEFHYPQISLTQKQIELLTTLFESLIYHIQQPIGNQENAIFRLCEVIAIDVNNLLHQNIVHRKISSRSEETFAKFLQLVPQHAVRHHNIAFYADQLNITPTYLSRIVQKISGRTVMSFLEYAITNEAINLLKHTDRSIADIAFILNFSDQSSFTKFFTRKKGMSPLEFRKKS